VSLAATRFDSAADAYDDEPGAVRIARAAGLEPVRVATTPPPRRAFLVWAEAPA
jgi:hypothetical protein